MKEKLLTLPRIHLTDRQLFDLEMLGVGGFAPLSGFMNEDDYEGAVENMRLANGEFWPMPIVLDVFSPSPYKEGEQIILCDKYGNPVSFFSITSVYTPDKKREARLVYGTEDEAHPGVHYLFHNTGDIYLGGSLEIIALPVRSDFSEWRFTPAELRSWFKEHAWEKVAAFQTRNPIHRAHFELMKRTHAEHGAHILIHPVVGITKEGDIDYITRVKSYIAIHEARMKDFAKLALLPLAMRMAGPREALFHALIRKNYGATHFIVGRDHAGPGKDSAGKPFYEMYAARDVAVLHEKELGIKIIPQEEMAYVDEEYGYMPAHEMPDGKMSQNISGTRFREMLANDEEVPPWFSFPEVLDELKKGIQRHRNRGFTIFFTGLSASGKSTIALLLHSKLLEQSDKKITLFDGDVVRQYLSKGLGFSKEDRMAHVERIGFVASEITKHGGIALCAVIAPYEESRQKNRRLISEHGNYIEVHIATPLDVCVARDPKGLYEKAKLGLVKGLTGIDDPYETPVNPEITINTDGETPLESVEHILGFLRTRNLI